MKDYYQNNDYEKGNEDSFFGKIITVILIAIIIFLLMIIGYKLLFINIQVNGNSMNPTLQNGDIYVASKLQVPQKGDLAIINIEERDYWLIKRIIATEGDSVKIENGKVYLKESGENEYKELDEPFIQGNTYLAKGQTMVWDIGENEYFFLGDNREHSTDSRFYGKRTTEDIVAVVKDWSIEQKGFWYDFNKVLNFPSKIISSWNSTTGE